MFVFFANIIISLSANIGQLLVVRSEIETFFDNLSRSIKNSENFELTVYLKKQFIKQIFAQKKKM